MSGAIYRAPTLFGISSHIREIIGKNAASVFPDAVEDESSRFLSVSNIALAAAICTSLRSFQPF